MSKKALNLLGFDLGASSGRAMLGQYDGERIQLTEMHRFSNDPVMLNGRMVWDVQRLFFEMKCALNKTAKAGIAVDSIGIDTWGVDFGLIGSDGALVGLPVHYRDRRNDDIMPRAFEVVPQEEIFEQTGLAFMQINTLYQLYAMKLCGDPVYGIADKLLMMPDLLAYFLTGKMGTEYTIASTSQLIDPRARDWAYGLIDKFGIPRTLFTQLEQPGTVRGTLLPEIARETGVGEVPVIAVCGHDTASAVAAVPAMGDRFAYISSGTWSLLGTELRQPLCEPAVMRANYTNEGGIDGTTRLLKNIMGLWIIQECKREWDRREDAVNFERLVELAQAAQPFYAMIDVDDPCFLQPGGMPARVQAYCERTGQPVPKGRGQICRVVYESLALKYRWSVERLEKDILHYGLDALNIVGGGSKNSMLNQFTANALGKPVIAGPAEGTAIGNLLVQVMALGAIDSLAALRETVARSFPSDTFLPEDGGEDWNAAYRRFLKLL
jgi:rhamnulokinase